MSKVISDKLYNAIMDQVEVSAKIVSIIEEEKESDFWIILNMEINRSLLEQKWDIDVRVNDKFSHFRFKFFSFENKLKSQFRNNYDFYLHLPFPVLDFNFHNYSNNPFRKRLYWTNIEGVGLPKDKCIKLQSILDSGYTEKEKAYCLTATYNNACVQNYFIKSERQHKFLHPVKRVGNIFTLKFIYLLNFIQACLIPTYIPFLTEF